MTPHSQDVLEGQRICKHGHIALKGKYCPQCVRDRVKEWRKNPENRELLLASRKRYNHSHKELINDLRNAWRKRNLETASWENMVRRCENPKHKYYSDYGGRGIRVCERWLGPDGLKNFRQDMGKKPSREYTIERRNNDLGYSPDNCYWATLKQQSRNKRSNRTLTFNGKTQCVTDWGEELGIPANSISTRLRLGWNTEDALTTPIKQYAREGQRSVKDTDEVMVQCWGRSQRLIDWSKEMNIPYHRLWVRVWKLKWPIEKALTTPRCNTGIERA